MIYSAEPGNLLSRLRQETSAAHRRLEDAIGIERCVADSSRYFGLLGSFLGFYRPLEARLEALNGWSAAGLDLRSRRKSPWIVSDLTAAGLAAREVAAIPDSPLLPPTDTLARGFGCLYVLEGATLGGRQITALMKDSPVSVEARCFFGSYGAATGERWREFIAALEAFASSKPQPEYTAVVDSATQTFALMHRWLADSGGVA